MLDVLEGAVHVPEAPQSWEGGQPPHVPPQPSSPQVFPVQLALQFAAGPPSEALPDEDPPDDDAPDDAPDVAPLDEPPPPSPPDEPPAPTSLPPSPSAAPEEPPSPPAV
jgi:hypothetical protein